MLGVPCVALIARKTVWPWICSGLRNVVAESSLHSFIGITEHWPAETNVDDSKKNKTHRCEFVIQCYNWDSLFVLPNHRF